MYPKNSNYAPASLRVFNTEKARQFPSKSKARKSGQKFGNFLRSK